MVPTSPSTSRIVRIGLVGVAVSMGVFAVKYVAWRATGSVALLADALETSINVLAAVISVCTLWLSAQPADHNHPWGHSKAEYLSALFEGLMMLGAAALNVPEVWVSWVHPTAPAQPLVGVALNVLGGLGNLVWGRLLLRYGRAYRSVALSASGRHTLTDVYASAGVVAAFALVPLTGWLRIDALVAAVVTANILWAGLTTLRTALAGLMDELSDPSILGELTDIIVQHGAGAREAHDMRVRLAGRMTFVDFHLVVDAQMTVAKAHGICDRIEGAIRQSMGPAMISIHLEPPEKAKGSKEGAVSLMGQP